MKYVVYTSVSILYLSAFFLICILWHWDGWLSIVGHVLSIITVTIAFIALMIILIWHYYGKMVKRVYYESLPPIKATIQAIIEMSLNPFWWFSSAKEEMFQKRVRELIDN